MKSSFQTRCILLCSALVVGLSVLSARLVQIQLVDRRYSERSQSERHTTERLWAMRGMIVDRHEEPLAKSVPVSSVIVDRKIMTDPTQASRALAFQQASEEPGWADLTAIQKKRRVNSLRGEILDREPAEVIIQKHLAYAVSILARPLGMRRDELHDKILNTKGNWFPIARELPQDVADQLSDTINRLKVQGIVIEGGLTRWYTAPDLAAHLIGFTGEVEEKDDDGFPHTKIVGRFGVESSMETYLAGRDGWREHYRDARGEVVPGPATSLKPPRAGMNVKLTVDIGLQAIVEEELDAGLKEFVADKGAVVLMDPKTGEVLAMASRPTFNLNLREGLGKEGNGAGVNYAIQTIYEPGSTIKIVPAAAALNEKLVTPQTSIFCHNGFYQGKGFKVTDEHPAGSLTVEGVLQKSNNNGAYSLGRQLGMKRYYEYLNDFGFGSRTGIQLSGESAGNARSTGKEVDFSRACYGYATNVTPLQLACAYSAIAGDGNLRKPHIVKSLIANDGTVIEDYQPEVVNSVLTPKAAKQMREALIKVTQPGGTATRAAVDGFLVGGKTGTVKKHNPTGGYYANRKIASFAGFMPAQDPAFVCVVVIDDPRPTAPGIRAQGGYVACPIFKNIATRVAAHMNLQPTEPIHTSLADSTR
ncbi:MAG: penicillin-binding protein 2 [Verrucomicrobiota bacterium]